MANRNYLSSWRYLNLICIVSQIKGWIFESHNLYSCGRDLWLAFDAFSYINSVISLGQASSMISSSLVLLWYIFLNTELPVVLLGWMSWYHRRTTYWKWLRTDGSDILGFILTRIKRNDEGSQDSLKDDSLVSAPVAQVNGSRREKNWSARWANRCKNVDQVQSL